MESATQSPYATSYPSDMLRPESRTQQQGFPGGMFEDGVAFIEDYARREPVSLALWALGIGFVLGWKLKPW
jgi:hypothetical protein